MKICDKKEGKIIDDFAQFFSLTFKGSPSVILIDKVLSYSHFFVYFLWLDGGKFCFCVKKLKHYDLKSHRHLRLMTAL